MMPSSGVHDKISSEMEVQSEDKQTSTSSAPPPSLTKKQKIIFVSMGFSYLCTVMSFSILAPFYSVEAKKKGVSTTVAGLVFGFFHLVIVLTAPVIGKYLPVFGAKFLFLTGVGLAATSNIIFGLLDFIQDTEFFVVSCFIVRAVEALGISTTITAVMVIASNAFPGRVAQTIGAMETLAGVGYIIGPAVGSLFYKIGGYVLPFITLGSVSWITLFINIFILPSVGLEIRTSGSVVEVLTIPAVYPTVLGVVVAGASMVFLDPTLPIYLASHNVAPEMSGLVFLLFGAAYGGTNPLWGYIADKWKVTRTLMIIAYLVQVIAMLMVGPPNLPFIPQDLWITILGVAVEGVAIACAITPSLLDMLDSAVWYGLPNDLSTFGVISGIFNSAFSLGAIIGPILGGYSVDQIGFQNTSNIIAGVNVLVMLMLFLFTCWEYQCGKGRRPTQWTIAETSETCNEDELQLLSPTR